MPWAGIRHSFDRNEKSVFFSTKAIKTLSNSPKVGIGVAAVVIPLVALGGGGGGDSGKNLTQARFS